MLVSFTHDLLDMDSVIHVVEVFRETVNGRVIKYYHAYVPAPENSFEGVELHTVLHDPDAFIGAKGKSAKPVQAASGRGVNPYSNLHNILRRGLDDESLRYQTRATPSIIEVIDQKIAQGRPRILVIGPGGGRIIYELRNEFQDAIELFFINREKIEVTQKDFIEWVHDGKADQKIREQVKEFLRYFQQNVIILNVDKGLKVQLQKRSLPTQFDIIIVPGEVLPYIKKKYEALRDIKDLL